MMLAFLPVLVLEVNTAAEQGRRAAENARGEALRLSRLCTSNQNTLLISVRQLLTVLAEMHGVQGGYRREQCEALFDKLLKENPTFSIVAMLDSRGNVVCSAPRAQGPVNLADRAFFQRAVESRSFAVGDYVFGRISQKPTLHMAQPLFGPDGSVAGVVYLGLDLVAMSHFGTGVTLPPGGSISVVGGDDIFLMRYPDPEKWVGRHSLRGMLGAAVPPGATEGVLEAKGSDGVERIYAVNRVEAPGIGSLYVSVGLSKKEAYAPFLRQMREQALMMTGFAFLAVASAWMLGRNAIVRPARHLADVARALSAGHLEVRSNLHEGEFGEIGTAFNQMAEALSGRIADLNEAQERLRIAHDELEERVEQRTAELRLRDRAIAAVVSGVIVTDPTQPDNPIVDANPAFERITGYSRAEVVGRNCRFLQGSETDHDGIQEIRESIHQGRECQAVLRNYRKDGTPFWNEVKITPVRDEAGRLIHFVGVLTDVTGRVEAQKALDRVLAELHRSNQELEQFAYMVSHDLQEPLRMVASYTQLLEHRYKDRLDADARDFIGYAVDGAKRMQGFIQDLLQYSRVGTQGRPFERLDVGTVLRHALDNLRFAIEEKKATVICGAMPQLDADPVQLGQLFQNLVGNALKFAGRDALRIEITSTPRDGEWEFVVADNGIGIAPEDFERIFVIFQRLHTRQEFEGTGIGLAICKRIVERHRGRIWVESEPGRGAAFHFTIPERHEEQL